jgi:hypothetical protein
VAVLQVVQGVAHGAMKQDEQQVPDAQHSGAAAADKANQGGGLAGKGRLLHCGFAWSGRI